MTGWGRVVSARLAAVVAGVLVLLGGCTAAGDADRAAGPTSSAAPGAGPPAACPAQPAEPAVGAQLLPRVAFDCLGGGRLDLGAGQGRPTVLNLWATWCPPCRAELPLVQQLADAAGDRLRVVGVVSRDGRPQAESLAADAGLTFPSAFDGEGQLMTGQGLRALPYTYFLDAGGGLVFTQVGPVTSYEQLRQLVAEHLGVQL